MRYMLLAGLLLLPLPGHAVQAPDTALALERDTREDEAKENFPGLDIVQETMRRHELYPYVYEEQTLVLMDAHQQRDVRRLRRYSRLDDDGTFHSLIEFAFPDRIAGTALLFMHGPDNSHSTRIFLPALGAAMTEYVGGTNGGQLLGSEFSLDDLNPEEVEDHVYRREADVVYDEVPYFVVLAESLPESQAAYAARRLFVRQDSFFITRIDYLDAAGRLLKRQTRHDLRRVGGEMWRADLIYVENTLNGHRSILKIDRRVYSRDYVPPAIFSEERILAAAAPVEKEPVEMDEGTSGMLDSEPEEVTRP